MLTFWRGWVDGMPGTIGARVGGATAPPLPRQGTPRPLKQLSLCCLRGPSRKFHFPGGRRETRKKVRTLRPRGPGWHPRLRLPLLGVLGSPARLLGLSPPSLPAQPGGGGHSDSNGSRPSQQHFGLRRDTETGDGER